MKSLPAEISSKDFSDALEEIKLAIATKWVFTGETTIDNFTDPYSLFEGNEKLIPSAVINPDGVGQVQKILKIAAKHSIPLWTVSVGRNFGYGGAPRIFCSYVLHICKAHRILCWEY